MSLGRRTHWNNAFGALTLGACVQLSSACAAPARADDVRVDSETTFQAYDVQSPASGVVWARRRLTQLLGLQWVKSFDPDALGPRRAPSLRAQLRLRLDRDFGDTCLQDDSLCFAIVNPERRGSYTPIADRGAVDLPSAYLELRDLPAGALVRAGRQLYVDEVGFARIDGLHARTAPASWVAFEAAAGTIVRRTSLAGADAFDSGHVTRLDLDDRERELFPYIASDAVTWLASISGELGDERSLRGRLTLRALHETTGFVEQRVGMHLASRATDPVRLDAHAVVDVLDPELLDVEAGAQLEDETWLAQLRLERHRPRFEPSTIWAYFDTAPVSIATLAGSWLPVAGVSTSIGVRGRRTDFDTDAEHDLGLDATFGLFDARDTLALAGFGWIAERGPLWGTSLSASRRLTYVIRLEAEISLYRVDDPLRAALRGVSLSELVAASFEISEESELRLQATHSYGEAARHRLSFLFFLHVGAWR